MFPLKMWTRCSCLSFAHVCTVETLQTLSSAELRISRTWSEELSFRLKSGDEFIYVVDIIVVTIDWSAVWLSELSQLKHRPELVCAWLYILHIVRPLNPRSAAVIFFNFDTFTDENRKPLQRDGKRIKSFAPAAFNGRWWGQVWIFFFFKSNISMH